ncbi:MAG: hypothetical protein M1821_002469 [Bathelium mastoideum]|nr:MAG: hypothetical protein M1821_002469 [Bathelium mastoideum]
MPPFRSKSSTDRRKQLASFIECQGTIMVNPCANCIQNRRRCRVHIRSGKCSECLRRGQRYDIQVTQSKWERLKSKKEELQRGIKQAYQDQEEARQRESEAHAAVQVAFAKEMRLRQQLDLLDGRVAEAIAVEERNIEEQENEECGNEILEAVESSEFSLSPRTWGAWDGLPPSAWEDPITSALLETLQASHGTSSNG